MDSIPLPLLGLIAGSAAASGIRLYATIAVLGYLGRSGILDLPPGLQVLTHQWVILIAAALYVVEFVADKIPIVDSMWDTVHTFIRVPAAVLLGFTALGGVSEPMRTIAALVAGSVALSAHGLKASARAAINTSPEPVTNWVASLSEEGLVAVLLYLAVRHPLAAVVIASGIAVIFVLALHWVIRTLRRLSPRFTLFSRRSMRSLAMVLSLGLAGCATSFSPERVRSEIAAQTGEDPQRVFEIQLGRVTMRTIRTALAGGGTPLPLAGLTGFDLAFYEVPSPSAQGAPLDFTKMAIRGWEPVVRTRQPGRSALVLVREGSATIDDLVLLGAAESRAIYLRLRGTLSPELPRALGDAFQSRGPEGLRDELVREVTRQR